MPFLRITTNITCDADRQAKLLGEASALVSAQLGKDERYFMGSIEPDRTMLFGGSDAPLALLELRALGLAKEKTPGLSRDLCALVQRHLEVPPDRTYLTFDTVERGLWGWNGDVF